MDLFRVQSVIYVLVALFNLRYVNTLTAVFIAGIMCFVAFGVELFLVIYLKVQKEKRE